MRVQPIALWMLLCAALPASAQTYINFNTPGVSISINVPLYPRLQRVPGYPVYYAPSLNSNYFFYDGLYWVYEEDNWYASSWYNGPWWEVNPMEVPVYLLRVPVRYYRHAPVYFRSWSSTEMPRWGDHWGSAWQQRRSGWNEWNRSSSPTIAPLPSYQRQYSGKLYPQVSQQAFIQTRDYRYQPNEAVAQQNFQHQRSQAQAFTPQQGPGRRDAVAPQPPRAQPPVQPPATAPRNRDQGGNEPRGNQQPTRRGEIQPAPQNREQPAVRPQNRPQQMPRNMPPTSNEPQASPPPAPRSERGQSRATPAAREQIAPAPQQSQRQNERNNQPATPQQSQRQLDRPKAAPAPQQPQRQAERPNPPQGAPAPPVAKPPASANDRKEKDQANDKGNDGEKGNDKEKKGRDR